MASELADQATGGAGEREAAQGLWHTPGPGRSEVRALNPFFFLFVERYRLLVTGSSGIGLAIPRWLYGSSSGGLEPRLIGALIRLRRDWDAAYGGLASDSLIRARWNTDS
jgi:hypothetical protein